MIPNRSVYIHMPLPSFRNFLADCSWEELTIIMATEVWRKRR